MGKGIDTFCNIGLKILRKRVNSQRRGKPLPENGHLDSNQGDILGLDNQATIYNLTEVKCG